MWNVFERPNFMCIKLRCSSPLEKVWMTFCLKLSKTGLPIRSANGVGLPGNIRESR